MFQLQFKEKNNKKEYKVEIICNNAIYARESKSYLSSLYYLVSWNNYLEKKIPGYLN